jgi:hypothetical protein
LPRRSGRRRRCSATAQTARPRRRSAIGQRTVLLLILRLPVELLQRVTTATRPRHRVPLMVCWRYEMGPGPPAGAPHRGRVGRRGLTQALMASIHACRLCLQSSGRIRLTSGRRGAVTLNGAAGDSTVRKLPHHPDGMTLGEPSRPDVPGDDRRRRATGRRPRWRSVAGVPHRWSTDSARAPCRGPWRLPTAGNGRARYSPPRALSITRGRSDAGTADPIHLVDPAPSWRGWKRGVRVA